MTLFQKYLQYPFFFLAQIPITPADRTVSFAKYFCQNIVLPSALHPGHTHSTRSTHSPLPYIDPCQAWERNCDTIIIHAGRSIRWTDSPFFTHIDQEVTVGKFISGAPAHLSSSDWSINQSVTQCLRPQRNHSLWTSLTSFWPAMRMFDYFQILKTFSKTGITCSEFTEVLLTGRVER